MNETIQDNTLEKAVDELEKSPSVNRIWEVDALRGLLIFLVMFDHLLFDFIALRPYFSNPFWQAISDFASKYYVGTNFLGKIRTTMHDAFVMMFVFLSGVSSTFSHNNLRRGIKMAIFAVLLTAASFAINEIMASGMLITFNVIHVVACSVLVWALIEFLASLCKKTWQKNLFGGTLFVVLALIFIFGYYFKLYPVQKGEWAYIFVQYGENAIAKLSPGDYLPLFPALAWFVVGAYLGKWIYKERTTRFPSVNAKYLAPFTFCGRYSLIFYIASQVVFYGLLYLFGAVFKVL